MTAWQAIRITAGGSRRAPSPRDEGLALAAGCFGLVVSCLAMIQLYQPAPGQTLTRALAAPAPIAETAAAETLAGAAPAASRALEVLAKARDIRSMAGTAVILARIGREIECLALNIYFEARSEPDSGKRAVAHVVMNRVADPRFPDDVCAVVQQGGEWPLNRCQFSWWCDGQSDDPRDLAAWTRSKVLAQQIYWGRSEDPTDGALWYHADYVAPSWGQALARAGKIGRHIFYLDRDAPGLQMAASYKMAAAE